MFTTYIHTTTSTCVRIRHSPCALSTSARRLFHTARATTFALPGDHLQTFRNISLPHKLTGTVLHQSSSTSLGSPGPGTGEVCHRRYLGSPYHASLRSLCQGVGGWGGILNCWDTESGSAGIFTTFGLRQTKTTRKRRGHWRSSCRSTIRKVWLDMCLLLPLHCHPSSVYTWNRTILFGPALTVLGCSLCPRQSFHACPASWVLSPSHEPGDLPSAGIIPWVASLAHFPSGVSSWPALSSFSSMLRNKNKHK